MKPIRLPLWAAVCVGLGLIGWGLTHIQANDRTPAAAVQGAWRLAQQIGAYQYSTTIRQISRPLPRLENVGLSLTEQDVYLEGAVDTAGEAFSFKVWSDTGSVLTRQGALEIKVENGKAYGRAGGQDWREVDNPTDLFAPGQDPLGFLHAAADITEAPEQTLGLRRFHFRLDGMAFAVYMREQFAKDLAQKGKLPAGLELPRLYRQMTGDGEIWLDAAGRPQRLVVNAIFPPQ